MKALLLSAFFLFTFGLFNILGIRRDLLLNEVLYVIIGFGLYFIVRSIGRHFFRINSYLFYWLFIGMLIVTFLIGIEANGSRRWIDLYFLKLQGSEIFKPFFILFFADFLSKKHARVKQGAIFLLSFLYFVLPAVIIFKQPDLGNALVYVSVYLVMIFFSPLPKRYFFYMIGFFLLAAPLGWMFMHDYQRARVLSFLNPGLDTGGNSYNMIQSMITVGSGQFAGKGLGLGTQSRLLFLPENHTDFAFSSLVEQFGFLGGFAVLMCFLALFLSQLRRIFNFFYRKDEDSVQSFLYIIGFFSYFLFQTIINIGMNMGLFPIAGIALPFISYGGSAVVAIMIGLALLPSKQS